MAKKSSKKKVAKRAVAKSPVFAFEYGPRFYDGHPAGFAYNLPERSSYHYAATSSENDGDPLYPCASVACAEFLRREVSEGCALDDLPAGGMFRVIDYPDAQIIPNGVWMKLGRRSVMMVASFDEHTEFGDVFKVTRSFTVDPVNYSLIVHGLANKKSAYFDGDPGEDCDSFAGTRAQEKTSEEPGDAHSKNAEAFFGRYVKPEEEDAQQIARDAHLGEKKEVGCLSPKGYAQILDREKRKAAEARQKRFAEADAALSQLAGSVAELSEAVTRAHMNAVHDCAGAESRIKELQKLLAAISEHVEDSEQASVKAEVCIKKCGKPARHKATRKAE